MDCRGRGAIGGPLDRSVGDGLLQCFPRASARGPKEVAECTARSQANYTGGGKESSSRKGVGSVAELEQAPVIVGNNQRKYCWNILTSLPDWPGITLRLESGSTNVSCCRNCLELILQYIAISKLNDTSKWCIRSLVETIQPMGRSRIEVL